jgi:hypothetical protein
MNPDPNEIGRALRLLYRPGDTIELRCFLRGSQILNGYYRDQDRLVADAMSVNESLNPQLSAYTCLNPCKPELYARRPDKIERAAAGEAVSDSEVLLRRWLLVDCDPIRPKGVSATDAQKAAAEQLVQQAYRYLTEQLQLPRPVVGDSGSGFHLLLRLADFPNDTTSKWACQQLLKRVVEHCKHDGAKIDVSMFNAARVCKLPGTVARKGSDIPEQPHRLAKLLNIPEPIKAIGLDQLMTIVGQPQDQSALVPQSHGNGWDIPALLEQRGIQYTEVQDTSDSGERWTKYSFDCPFSQEHSDGFVLGQWDNGAIFAKCHHDSCQGKGWEQLKQIWQLGNDAGIRVADIILPTPPAIAAAITPTLLPQLQSFIDPPEAPKKIFYGPIGEIVQGIAKDTEAAAVAVFASALTYFGNAAGRRFYVQLDQWHFPKLYVALVGATGSGRKGTADFQGKRIVDAIDPTAALYRHSGLTTGEGMLSVLDENRDGMYPRPAVFVEREFAAVFRRAERRGNTLSSYIRDAWDNDILANSTKGNPVRIEDHHVSVCAHVTPSELKRLMSASDIANGFANRFLWIYTKRSDRNPDAQGFRPDRFRRQIEYLTASLERFKQRYNDANQPVQIPFNSEAAAAWRDHLYADLDVDCEDDTQLVLMTNRQPQQVCRIALILALADGRSEITLEHLTAAKALITYVRDSIDYILSRPWWGDAENVHDPAGMAPKVMEALRAGSMYRRDIRNQVFSGHRTAKELNTLRDLMVQAGQVRIEQAGRAEIWHRLL